VDVETQDMAQAAEAGAVERLCKNGLRIEPGNERLRANEMRDRAGGQPNGAVGPEVDAESREHRQHEADGGDKDPLPDGHAFLRWSGHTLRAASASAAAHSARPSL